MGIGTQAIPVIADTGAAVAALAMCFDNTKESDLRRRELYRSALLKYDQWVRLAQKAKMLLQAKM